MLVHNDVIENVVATVDVGIHQDIHTLVCKRPSIALPPPSPVVLSLNIERTQDSLSFLLPSSTNDIQVPLESTSQVKIH
jgi:hypothetical protein